MAIRGYVKKGMENNMFDIQIVLPEEQDAVKKVCQRLWEKCFDDSAQYIKYYFNNRWHGSITFISDNVSMLHLNPYRINLNKKEFLTYYIVGVCTLEKYRRRGYMDNVLKCALRYMYGKSVPFAYLMPASEKIYKPYGFNGIYSVKSWDGSLEKLNAAVYKSTMCNNVKSVSYDMLTESQKDSLVQYTKESLSKHFSCYAVHDIDYFEELYTEMLACNGGIDTFWNSGQCTGYIVYLCEECNKIEIVESVFEDTIQNDVIKHLKSKGFSDYISLYETAFWNLKDVKMPKNHLMARIVDLRAFVMYLPSGLEMWLDVTDRIISGNNGKWHIITGDDTICHLCENDSSAETRKYTKYTIEELGQLYLTKPVYYINELV